jgi:antitoxin (DNA-binding transcriptional repressor) of toxin-antitoxin stability system
VVNVPQARTHLCQLLQAVEQGEEVMSARADGTVGALAPGAPPHRPPGAMGGRIGISDDFDAPHEELREALA